MNNKFRFLALLGIVMLIWACEKETFLSENPSATTEQSKVAVKHNFTDPTTVNALENLQGGEIDDVLQSIENSLNLTYGYADQSIGEISVLETEFTVPSNCSDNDASAIYNNALALWAENNQTFDGEDPQAILVDLEKLDTPSENGDIRVKVSTFVGEPQENAELSPCDNVTFPTGTYELYKPSKPTKNKLYAGDRMTSKLNAKLNNNPCVYFEDVKEFPLTLEQSTITVSGKTTLNKTDMEANYCAFLATLKGLNLPAGYAIQSVVVRGDVKLGNPGGKLYISSVKIGKPKLKKPPCNKKPLPSE